MKIKEGYLLREVAGNYIVVAIGEEAVNFDGMITLNETGAFMWKKLEEGMDEAGILEAMMAEYDADADVLSKDIAMFVEKLQKADLLEK